MPHERYQMPSHVYTFDQHGECTKGPDWICPARPCPAARSPRKLNTLKEPCMKAFIPKPDCNLYSDGSVAPPVNNLEGFIKCKWDVNKEFIPRPTNKTSEASKPCPKPCFTPCPCSYSCNYPSGYSCCYPSRYSCNYPCNYPCNYSGSRLACGGENFIANKWTGNSREILGQQRLAAGAEKIPGNSKATFGHQMAVCCKMVSVNRLTRNYEENPNQCLTGGNEKLKSVEEVPWKWKKHKHLASIVEKHQIRSMCHQRACCDVGPQLLTEEQLICPPRTDRMPEREPGPGARVCPDGTAALINIGNQNPHFKCKVTRKTQMRVLRDSKSPHASYYDSFFHEKPTRNSNFSRCQLCCEDGACSNSAATLLECHG